MRSARFKFKVHPRWKQTDQKSVLRCANETNVADSFMPANNSILYCSFSFCERGSKTKVHCSFAVPFSVVCMYTLRLSSLQDRRYADLTEDQLPSCESLKDTIARALPYWNEEIVPQIKQGKRVLIAAHGNSLRGIVKHLEGG